MTNLDAATSHQPGTACNRRGPRSAARIFGLLEHLVHAYRSRRDAGHLAGLSDHLLKDIGITRSHIDIVVRGSRHPYKEG